MISMGSVSGGSIPLAFLPEGATGTVYQVLGGRGASRHLEDMGFAPTAKVLVLKSCPPGAMLVMVKESRIALGRGMAMKILVKNIEEP
ncbi:MAG: ferrous iron transport protein A [Methanotrichaceae archaeon]|nr:ferrous iron transport protein A [Methanotrichaceae archaeon]